MSHTLLSVMVAGSIQMSADAPRPVDLAALAVVIAQAVPDVGAELDIAERPLTVCDVPFYYDDLAPVPLPRVRTLVPYDWRSPVVFDVP